MQGKVIIELKTWQLVCLRSIVMSRSGPGGQQILSLPVQKTTLNCIIGKATSDVSLEQ